MKSQEEVLSRFRNEFTTFETASHQYEKQEIDDKAYKAVSTGFGDYLQRDRRQMLRIRVPGGRLTMAMTDAILAVCRQYKVSVLKVTAGQALQLHDLGPHAGRRLILRLLDAGIVTRGSGGDNPNNVSATALSGVSRDGCFDVQPYAAAADRYLLQYTGVEPLPRKFKIGFSDLPANETHATFKDLGFAANEDGTFDVYAAGGLGIKPKCGLKVASHINPKNILYYMRTMLDVYMENGNYENRNKARSRFLQDTMGADGFLEAYRKHLAEVLEQGSLTLDVEEKIVTKQGTQPLPRDPRVVPQKQNGLCAVSYHPIGGYLPIDRLESIRKTLLGMEDTEIRLANDGGLFVINLTGDEAERVLAVTAGGAFDDISASVACVGHRRCDIGVADSQQLLRDCIAAVEPEHFPNGTLPVMHISGCISSCGSQQIGAIGWRGVARKTEEGMKDAYFFSYGGCARQGEEKLVTGTRVMLADKIPAFLVELGRMIQPTGLKFDEWLPEHEADLEALADRYAMPKK